MGVTSFFKNCTFLMAILILLSSFLLDCVMANVYAVGDQEEWSSQTNYASWAERYNFSLGDVLVFKYVKGQHNVYEVTEKTFRSCDGSSGVLGKYESGEDRVVLKEVKRYWFICNIAGHCLGGMRFGIEVKKDSSNNVKYPPTATATATNSTYGGGALINPQIEPTPSDNSCRRRSYVSQRWSVIGNFLPFGTGLLLFSFYFL